VDVRARLLVFLDVLAAVEHAHASSIVHRDIKPSNVLVTSDGQVKLLDFGIGKLLDSDSVGHATMLTRDGGVALTPEYAAPEQLTGSDRVAGDRRVRAGRPAVRAADGPPSGG
jgi:serine/threonine protein kinase